MKALFLILTLTIFVYSQTPAAAISQRKTRVGRQPQPPPSKTVVPAEKEYLDVEISYDQFTDDTSISVGEMFLPFERGRLLLIANYSYPGKSGATANIGGQHPSLFFIFRSSEALFARNHEMIILAGGERLRFGDLTYKWDVKDNQIEERMSSSITKDGLRKIATATPVRLRIGIYDFELAERHKAALAMFVDRLP